MVNPRKIFIQTLQNVEFLCKSTCKSQCKFRVKNVYYSTIHQNHVQNLFFPPTFPTFPTILPTAQPPLLFNYFFHYSTAPTITTTNNKIIERTN